MLDTEYLEAKNIAFKYVVYRRRTENEVREKLKSLNYNSDIIQNIIDELIEFEYLNDKIYVQKFIEKNKKDSVSLLKMKLSNKGISKELIEEYFNNNSCDEVGKIIRLLEKKKYNDNLENSQKDKIKAYCARRGFKVADIEKAIKRRKENVEWIKKCIWVY